jgi:hypothetical protein
VKVIDYFLRCCREDIIQRKQRVTDIEAQLAALEQDLRGRAGDRHEVAVAGD